MLAAWAAVAGGVGCAPADATGLGFGALLARSIGALVVVAGLAVIVLRLAARAGVGTSGASRLTVLARTGVAPRSEVLAVAVADRVVVVGLTPAGMHPLAELSRQTWDATATTGERADSASAVANDGAFADRLAAAATGAAARRLGATGALDPDDEIRIDAPTDDLPRVEDTR